MFKTTSSLACLVSALLFAPVTQATVLVEQPYAIEWSTQIGTSAIDQSVSVAVDGSGNTYISGITSGSLGGTSAGNYDAFLAKFDASGSLLWTRQIGTANYDSGNAVAVDSAGNAYITGSTRGNLGGTTVGLSDAFLMKYDPSGNLVWSQQTGTARGDISRSVVVDSSSNIYICGDTTYVGYGGTDINQDDTCLTKFDSSGNVMWTRQIFSTEDDNGHAVAVDNSGNVYIGGSTYGYLDGAAVGSYDAYLMKFDSSGNQLWTQELVTTGTDANYAVATDSLGNVYTSGYTGGDLGGDSAGFLDAFLAKYDSSGNMLWSRQIGTYAIDRSYAVAVDSSGSIFISGFTEGDLEGPNLGSYDAFLTKYNASGDLLWTKQFGTVETDESRALAIDSAGNVYSSGLTDGSLGGTNAGNFDAFLVKFTIPEPTALSLLALGGLALLRHPR